MRFTSWQRLSSREVMRRSGPRPSISKSSGGSAGRTVSVAIRSWIEIPCSSLHPISPWTLGQDASSAQAMGKEDYESGVRYGLESPQPRGRLYSAGSRRRYPSLPDNSFSMPMKKRDHRNGRDGGSQEDGGAFDSHCWLDQRPRSSFGPRNSGSSPWRKMD